MYRKRWAWRARACALALCCWAVSGPAQEPESEAEKGRVPLTVKATDPEGDQLLYEWVQISGPQRVRIANPASPDTYFIPSEPGEYVFEIRVSDGKTTVSKLVTKEVVLRNQAPVAVAGPDETYEVGQRVLVDGGRSSDPDGRVQGYRWIQVSGPTVKLAPERLADRQFDFVAKDEGAYVFELAVSDGKAWSEPSRVTITVRPPNSKPKVVVEPVGKKAELPVQPPRVTPVVSGPDAPPLAVVGKGGVVKMGQDIVLDGSGSRDPLGEPLEFFWSQKENQKSPLLKRLEPMAESAPRGREGPFACPIWRCRPTEPGIYEFVLEVTAGRGDKLRKATAEMTFEVAGPNRAPVAEVFLPEPKVEKGQPVTLDGSRSRDPDGDRLEYTWGPSGKGLRPSKWALQEGPRAQFIPDQEGTYGIQLVVSDGKLKSEPCEVSVSVLPANRPPTVRAPALVEGVVGEPLRIEATASDPDNDRIEIAWSVVEPKNLKLPAEVLNANPLVFTPSEERVYAFSVVASDARGASQPAQVQVAARTRVRDLPPTAIIEGPRSALVGEKVALSGERSSDPEKKRLTYQWKQLPEGGAPRLPAAAPAPTENRWEFTPTAPGEYRISLVVNDGANESQAHVWSLTVERQNRAPTALIEPPRPVTEGDEAALNGGASSDPDGDQLTFRWRVLEGAERAQLSGQDQARLRVKTTAPGPLRLELVVNDGKSDSAPATVTLEVGRKAEPPVASVSGPEGVVAGQEVTLSAEGSRSPGGARITGFEWSQLTGPRPDQPFQGADVRRQNLSFRPSEPGRYSFQLVVADENGLRSRPVTFSFNVQAPVRAPAARVQLEGRGPYIAGQPVILSGRRSSDPAGQPLTYRWSAVGQTAARLTIPADAAETARVVPQEPGEYTVELRVHNGQAESPAASIQFSVEAPEVRPTAVISAPQTGEPGKELVLDGSGSHGAPGRTLDYTWTLASAPRDGDANFGYRGQRKPKPEVTFTAPGEYVVELRVSDGKQESEPARATIQVGPANQAPLASAVALTGFSDADFKPGVDLAALPHVFKGTDLTVEKGWHVLLDGSGSRDPDQGPQPLSGAWKRLAGPAPERAEQVGLSLHLVPAAAGRTEWVLTVSDGRAESKSAVVAVTVLEPGTLPVAKARVYLARADAPAPDEPPKRNMQLPAFRRSPRPDLTQPILILDGQASTCAPGKTLRYGWRQISGEDLQLRPEKLAKPRVGLLIYHPGTYRFLLTVQDGEYYGLPATVDLILTEPSLIEKVGREGRPEDEGSLLPPPKDVRPPGEPRPKTTPKPEVGTSAPAPGAKADRPAPGTEDTFMNLPPRPAAAVDRHPATEAVRQRVEALSRADYRAGDPIFRRHKARLEGLIAQPGWEAEAELLRALKDKDPDLRVVAAQALRQRGLGSVASLIKILEDPQHPARAEALWALQQLSGRAYEADPAQWKQWWAEMHSARRP